MKNGCHTHKGLTAKECRDKAKELEGEAQHILYQCISGDDYILRGLEPPPQDADEKRWALQAEAEDLQAAAKRLDSKDRQERTTKTKQLSGAK